MADFKIKTLSWLAPLAIVGSVALVACGDEDASESTGSVSPAAAANGSDRHLANLAADAEVRAAVAGSDVHLENLAADAEVRAPVAGSDVHLENLAAEIEQQSGPAGSDVHLANQAAEAAEQQAKLDNAAETYASIDEPEPTNDEFLPGSRRVPTR